MDYHYELEYYTSQGYWQKANWFGSKLPQTLEEAIENKKLKEAATGGTYSYRVVKVTRKVVE